MKFEYDKEKDLLYVYFRKPGIPVIHTETIVPGVYVDFDDEDKVIGLEVLDASQFIDQKIEFELPLLKASA